MTSESQRLQDPENPPGNSHSRSRRRLSLASFLLTLPSLLWIAQAALLAQAVQRIVDGGGMRDVLLPAGLFALVGLLKSLAEAAGGRMAFQAARGLLSDRRERALDALSRRSPVDPGRPSSGEVASMVGEQAEMIVPYYSRFLPARLKAVLAPLAILLFVLPVSWITALLLLLAAPLIPVFMALIGLRAKAESERQLAAAGGLNAFLLDRLRGLATLRTLGAVEATALDLRRNALDLKDRTMAVLKIAFLSSAVLELVSALGVAMVAVYVGFSLLGEIGFGMWGSRLDLGSGLFVLLLAPAFFEPLRELSAAWHDRAAGQAALEALERLGSAAPVPAATAWPQADATHPARSSVSLERVSFRYASEQPLVIENLELDIGQGEHVALVGRSGIGKSTLLALIAGLAAPERGRILVGGIPLTAESAGMLRRRIAWIGQKPHIFAGSIAHNVSLGREGVTPAAIREALRLARLDRVAAAYGNRPLGEGGLGLSGGEAMRLAIARAAVDPEIRIILADEPTAHLDSSTAREVMDSLMTLSAGRTLVVATHDPALMQRMDRCFGPDRSEFREAAE